MKEVLVDFIPQKSKYFLLLFMRALDIVAMLLFLYFYYFFSYSSSLTIPIWLDNLDNCASSSKSDLRKCTNAVGISDCTHRDDVVLTCKGGEDYSNSSHVSNLYLWPPATYSMRTF